MSSPMLMLNCKQIMPTKKITQLIKPLAEIAFRFLVGTSAPPHF